jgi:nicotinate-nucleotide adenylyltransferase
LKRIGIFGGTFNPIHTAHLIVAEDVREQMNLDNVLFIPAANPPHKGPRELIDTGLRIKMAELAVSANPFFEVSGIEIELSKTSKSYTVNTLNALRKLYPEGQAEFYLIIGMDQLAELHTWKDPEKLMELSQIIVINRPGFSNEKVQKDYVKRVKFLPVPDVDISSTQIRQRIKENKSIKYLVPDAVEKFITENKLYKQI